MLQTWLPCSTFTTWPLYIVWLLTTPRRRPHLAVHGAHADNVLNSFLSSSINRTLALYHRLDRNVLLHHRSGGVCACARRRAHYAPSFVVAGHYPPAHNRAATVPTPNSDNRTVHIYRQKQSSSSMSRPQTEAAMKRPSSDEKPAKIAPESPTDETHTKNDPRCAMQSSSINQRQA